MHAAIIEVLSAKGQFKPEQALAVAEAIDMAIERAQLVTVPILDSRFANVAARFEALEARFEARFVAFEAKIDARFETFEARFDRFRLQIIIAIILSQVAFGPFGAAVVNAVKRALF